MEMVAGALARGRRRLILRDSMAIAGLVAVTAVLFGVTLFLFRSFSGHRADLALRWSDRGRAALVGGRATEAIEDLRTALGYAPDTRAYELLLAQALADAGRVEESYNYYLGLREATQGDGAINLALARLAAAKGDRATAVDFYQDAISGAWESPTGSGRPSPRAEARLELARYLIAGKDTAAARTELLIAGENGPANRQDLEEFDLTIALLLEQGGDAQDAWAFYGRVLAIDRENLAALEGAGKIAFAAGEFRAAEILLKHAAHDQPPSGYDIPSPPAETAPMEWQAARILEMTPSPDLPVKERVRRVLMVREIAKARLAACSAELGGAAAALAELQQRWTDGPYGGPDARALAADAGLQDGAIQLAYDTEIETAKQCTVPEGWDSLLLTLAKAAQMPRTLDLAKVPLDAQARANAREVR